MKNDNLERLLSTIRDDQLDDEVIAKAAERIWKSIRTASPGAVFSLPGTDINRIRRGNRVVGNSTYKGELNRDVGQAESGNSMKRNLSLLR